MSFMGIPRGRRKAFSQVRIVTDNVGASKLYRDGDAGTVFTVTLGAWLEIVSVAQNTQNVNQIEIFDSTGETKYLGTGAAAAEVLQTHIVPGGTGVASVRIDAGTRLTLKYLVTPATNSETVINFFD